MQDRDAEGNARNDRPPIKAKLTLPIDAATLNLINDQKLNTIADVIRLLPPELVEYVQKKLVRMLASLEDDDKANDTPTSS